jgi:hypothetical protein
MPEQAFIAVMIGKVPEVVGFAEVSRRTPSVQPHTGRWDSMRWR